MLTSFVLRRLFWQKAWKAGWGGASIPKLQGVLGMHSFREEGAWCSRDGGTAGCEEMLSCCSLSRGPFTPSVSVTATFTLKNRAGFQIFVGVSVSMRVLSPVSWTGKSDELVHTECCITLTLTLGVNKPIGPFTPSVRVN